MNDKRPWRTPFGKAPCSCAVFAGALLSLGSARAHATERELEVDLSRLGAPVSPYLHGQFIEHLGRCIHDGIWAEKLWDRKFLLEPGKTWEVVKPEGAAFEAFHDPAGAYAGERCMALWVRDPAGGACGLRQGRIGLSEGREYLGYAVLAHLGDPVPVEIRLSWGPRPEDSEAVLLRDVGREYRKHPFRFRAPAATSEGSLAILVSRPAYLWLACLSLQPSDAVRGMRRDTLDLLRDRLRAPVTRWPGGNFVSGYDWKDGIGERDRRPPRWERAWNDVEDNDFGVDEFLAFCKAVGTEPYIAVNAGLGSAEGAADLVEYVNGPVGTRWGDERARNGHPEPYGVRWWGVGNEMYGSWQLGNVPVERYALRHNAFVRAMKARDPEIRTIAVGAPGPWNDAIVRECGAHMDLLSAHHYTERKLRLPFSPEDARAYEERFLEYSGRVAAGIRGLVDDFRRRVARGEPGTERIRLAIDEWGIVRDWNAAPDGPGVGAFEHYYCLGDAIAVARGLHEILRSADLVAMANWAQAVNVIGAVKTGKEGAVLDPAGLVLAEYRKRFASGRLAGIRVPEGLALDAVATWESGGPSGAESAPEALGPGTLRVGLVNYGPDAIRVPLRVGPRFEPSKEGAQILRIEGDSLGAILVPRARAESFGSARPDEGPVRAREETAPASAPLSVPGRSIAILELDGGPGG
ncbi:MAG: alpha-L-arabinofuranosidase C-terminal domain-containing protein [Planctomycetota bacterium]